MAKRTEQADETRMQIEDVKQQADMEWRPQTAQKSPKAWSGTYLWEDNTLVDAI